MTKEFLNNFLLMLSSIFFIVRRLSYSALRSSGGKVSTVKGYVAKRRIHSWRLSSGRFRTATQYSPIGNGQRMTFFLLL
jgi:hypothetical protein